MADDVVEGVQLPADGAGKITGAFILKGTAALQPIVLEGVDNVYLPATVIVDARGVEISGRILAELGRIAGCLERLEELQLQSTAVLTG